MGFYFLADLLSGLNHDINIKARFIYWLGVEMFGARAEKKAIQRANKAIQDAKQTTELQRVAHQAIADFNQAVCIHRELVREHAAADSYLIHQKDYLISYKVSDGGCSHVGDLFAWAVSAASHTAKEENTYAETPMFRTLDATSLKRGNQWYLRINIVVDRNCIWLKR